MEAKERCYNVGELLKASLVMYKMGVIDKLRKETTEKSQRRHFQAEERASTAGRVCLACHNRKRASEIGER